MYITLLVVNVYLVGWYNYYSVSCTHYSVSCKHLLFRLYVCTYYSISCKHFAKFMSVTLPLVCTSYCVSCMHYSSFTHYSVGCMPYSVSCVHDSVKLWKVWTQRSFHCGQQKEPAIYSWSASLFLLYSWIFSRSVHIPVLYQLICMVWMVCGLEGPVVEFKVRLMSQ